LTNPKNTAIKTITELFKKKGKQMATWGWRHNHKKKIGIFETISHYLSKGGVIFLLPPALSDTNLQYTQPCAKQKLTRLEQAEI